MQIRNKITNFKVPSCKYIIIDTDAGGDDAQAIILAVSEAKRQGKTILGITCVDGNASLENVAINVLIVLSLCEYNVPVFKGAKVSLVGTNVKDFYFSEDGIGMKQKQYLDELTSKGKYRNDLLQQKLACDFIAESCRAYGKDLAIVAIGPLTNLALAYHLDNCVAETGMVSIMGGSISGFGIRDYFASEFNFHLDPQAAKIVLLAFRNVYIASFDMSLDIGASKTLALFTERERPKARFINNIHGVILSTHKPSMCDPIAIILAMCPEDILFLYEGYADVELNGQRIRGCMSWDWLGDKHLPGRSKVRAAGEIDLQKLRARVDQSYN